MKFLIIFLFGRREESELVVIRVRVQVWTKTLGNRQIRIKLNLQILSDNHDNVQARHLGANKLTLEYQETTFGQKYFLI